MKRVRGRGQMAVEVSNSSAEAAPPSSARVMVLDEPWPAGLTVKTLVWGDGWWVG